MEPAYGYVHPITPDAEQLALSLYYRDLLTEIIHEDIPDAVNPD